MDLDPELARQLNDEVTRERYAQAAYSEIANWADGLGFSGLRDWADKQAAEEGIHAQRFIEYLRDRDQCLLQELPAPGRDFDGYAGALGWALSLERTVSAALAAMYHLGQAVSDGALLSFLQPFLAEQVEAERDLEIYLQKVGRGAPLDLLDHELFA